VSDPQSQPKVDELLDRAFQAITDGDRATANILAGRVLAMDRGNPDAEDLLAAPDERGEIRRLTIFFADLVDSTALSTRIEPEVYRTVVGGYKEVVRQIVDRYEGHIGSVKGDGLLGVFGHPLPHENDAERAVRAGLEMTREVVRLSEQVRRRFGFDIQVRVGVHRGVVYLDIEQDDVYGLAANMTARVSGLAPPDSVVVSASIERLVRDRFELERLPAQRVKGIDEPVDHYLVVAERAVGARARAGPVVARQREVAYLEGAWAQATAGTLSRAGVAFRGEAGIGKSRLTRVAADLAERSGHTVVTLLGSPFHTDVGLQPVRRLLEERCLIGRALSPSERLERLTAEVRMLSLEPGVTVPLLAPVLGISPEAGYEPVHADGRKLYRQIVAGVCDYLVACAGGAPAVILAEDMHWFDEDTVEVVEKLVGRNTGNLLVVLTNRVAGVADSRDDVEQFDLKPLSNDETDQLVSALHPDMGAKERAVVRRRCDGIPLYIEEVVAKLTELATDASSQVPDSLYEALFTRLRSSRGGIKVVEAAAIIGSRVDRSLLHDIVELPESDVDDAIRDLTEVRVFVPVDDESLRFRHELLRELAAELSPPSVRRRIHSRIADALRTAAPAGNTDWPLIASHYARADRHQEAITAYQKASSEARRRGAVVEARGFLGNALAQLDRTAPGPGRDRTEVAVRLRRGFLSYVTEGAASPNAFGDFGRCLELSGTSLTDDLFATLTALYGYYAIRADLRHAQQVLEAVEVGISDGRAWAWPTIGAGFGMVAWYRGHFDEAREKLETAASLRQNVGSAVIASWFMANEPIASVYTHLALARYVQGDLAGAEAFLDATRVRCDEVGLPQGPFSLAYARQLEVLMRIDSGELDRAAEVVEQLIADAERYDLEMWTTVGAAQKAVVRALQSIVTQPNDTAELGVHVATVTAIVDTWRTLEIKSMVVSYDAVIARLLIAGDRFDEARDRLDLGLRLADETGMHYYDAELLRLRAHAQRDDGLRRADLRSAMELARRQSAPIFELKAAVDAVAWQGESAQAALAESVGRFPADSTWPDLVRARALLE
jgi:class 3 adenylate cyclase/tetratricopeptide (TPR) repeat protein